MKTVFAFTLFSSNHSSCFSRDLTNEQHFHQHMAKWMFVQWDSTSSVCYVSMKIVQKNSNECICLYLQFSISTSLNLLSSAYEDVLHRAYIYSPIKTKLNIFCIKFNQLFHFSFVDFCFFYFSIVINMFQNNVNCSI